MMEVRDLYQELILDHNRSPKNFGVLGHATHEAEGANPLCGDSILLSLIIENGAIIDVRFQGSGCAISRASSSLMTAAIKGKQVSEAEQLARWFQEMVTTDSPRVARETHGKLAVFAGVREFPVRVKCATLPWHTLRAALRRTNETVTTE